MISSERLSGKAIFLSASVPAKGSGFEDERLDLNVDDAVIALARTVFSEGGVLVFGGHPSISPLVATIAGEYAPMREDGKPLALIYQSKIFEPVIPKKTLLLMEMGYATIEWTEAAPYEKLRKNPKTGRYEVPESLKIMRERMIGETDPEAFVAIGGMEGIEEEVDLFHQLRPNARVYTLETTGGASSMLTRERPWVRPIDRVIREQLVEHYEGRDFDQRPAALYPVVMERIVQELSR